MSVTPFCSGEEMVCDHVSVLRCTPEGSMCVREVVSFVLVKLYVEAVTYLIFIFTANGILERLTGQLVYKFGSS